MKHFFKLFFLVLIVNLSAFAQQGTISPTGTAPISAMPKTSSKKFLYRDVVSFGIGIGQDFGGMGINCIAYPHKNIGLFGGVGFALAGPGYNVGTKLRIIPKTHFMSITPYAVAMYGYNAAVLITDLNEYNKLFYGFSAGAGIDLRNIKNKGYWNFGITIPFRENEVQDYKDYLTAHKQVEFKGKDSPVTISVGYHRVLY